MPNDFKAHSAGSENTNSHTGRKNGEHTDSGRPRSEGSRGGDNRTGSGPRSGARSGGFTRSDSRPGERGARPARNFEGRGEGSADRGARGVGRGGRDSRPRSGGFGAGGAPRMSLSEEIMQLDQELLRLLTRRSVLVQKLRKGKTHAATPAIIKSEKQIRAAWEAAAGKISRNPRLIRQFYSLVQELDIKEQTAGDYTPFNMAPARQPVNVSLQGPASSVYARLCFALATASGAKFKMGALARSNALMDLVKAFAQCGVEAEWEKDANGLEVLSLAGGKELAAFTDNSIFVGDDLLSFYLMAFVAAGRPGKVRFTGGLNLKEADLTVLGRFMPLLGARLAWVMPGSRGLPVSLECSGALPAVIEVPADMPPEAIMALLLAAATWQTKITIKTTENINGKRFASFLLPLLKVAAVQHNGSEFNYTGAALTLPEEFAPVLSPVLSSVLLALPLFAGGSVKLYGKFVDNAQFAEISELLSSMPLELKVDSNSVYAAATSANWPAVLECAQLSPRLRPLFWALNARIAHKNKGSVRISTYPEGANLVAATEFLAQSGFNLGLDGSSVVISPMSEEDFKEVAAKNYGWSCPGAAWAIALSLTAFIKANLKINNPDCVSDVSPYYWKFYNSLPEPKIGSVAKIAEEKASTRRRVMTNTVIEPEDLLDTDEE